MKALELPPFVFAGLRADLQEALIQRVGIERQQAGLAADQLLRLCAQFGIVSRASFEQWAQGLCDYARDQGRPDVADSAAACLKLEPLN